MTDVAEAEDVTERLLVRVRAIEGTPCPVCDEDRICGEIVSDQIAMTAMMHCGCGNPTTISEPLTVAARRGCDEMGW